MSKASTAAARRREMWIRRIISSVILLAVVVGVVFLVIRGIGMIGGMLPKATATPQSGAMSSASQPTSVIISPCSVGDLQITATSDPAAPVVGGGLTLGLSVENKTAKECSLALPDLEVRLSTGSDTVWAPTQCSDTWNGNLLMLPGTPWSASLQWDGKLYDACTLLTDDAGTGLVADPGTYHVQVAVKGEWADSTLTLQVQ